MKNIKLTLEIAGEKKEMWFVSKSIIGAVVFAKDLLAVQFNKSIKEVKVLGAFIL